MRITVQNRTVSESHLSYSVLVNIGIIILFMLTAQLSSSRYKINKQWMTTKNFDEHKENMNLSVSSMKCIV